MSAAETPSAKTLLGNILCQQRGRKAGTLNVNTAASGQYKTQCKYPLTLSQQV